MTTATTTKTAKPDSSDHSMANGISRPKRASNGHRRQADRQTKRRVNLPSLNDVPAWAKSIGSVVGVSIAVGWGLFATRSQWLPLARDLTDQVRNKLIDQTKNLRGSGEMSSPSAPSFPGASDAAGTSNAL